MESMPMRLLRRELGWNYQHKSDYKKLLCSLHNREEDRISTAIKNIILDTHILEDTPIYDLDFCGQNTWLNIVAAGDERGFVTLVNTHEGIKPKEKIVNRHRCHQNAIFDTNWSPQKTGLFATGSADQSVKVWDASRGFELLRVYKQHTRTVKAVRFHPSHPDILASGSRDGSIMVWDCRTPDEGPENFIVSAHALQCKSKLVVEETVSVTDLLFKDDNTLVSSGSSDGFIKFWDIRKTYKCLKRREPVRKIPYPVKDTTCVGISSLCLDELNNLYAASACTEIFKFNLSSDSDAPESCFQNNRNMQFFVKIDVSRDGRFLIAGSRNSYAHIWDTWDCEARDPFTYLEGQALDCTLGCAVFSPYDPLTIVTGGDDSTIVIWRVNNLKSSYKKCGGSSGTESLPLAPLDSLRMKQQQNLQTFIPLYRRSQVAQVVGTWAPKSPSKSPKKITPSTSCVPVSTTFNLCSLLSDLPNFVIDGRMCHLPERTHSAVSRKHTWLGDFGTTEREKRPSPSTLQTPPKRLKRSSNSNSTNSPLNLCTPPRKPARSSIKCGSGSKRNKAELRSPSAPSNVPCLTSPSIVKYFTTPLRASNLSVPEY